MLLKMRRGAVLGAFLVAGSLSACSSAEPAKEDMEVSAEDAEAPQEAQTSEKKDQENKEDKGDQAPAAEQQASDKSEKGAEDKGDSASDGASAEAEQLADAAGAEQDSEAAVAQAEEGVGAGDAAVEADAKDQTAADALNNAEGGETPDPAAVGQEGHSDQGQVADQAVAAVQNQTQAQAPTAGAEYVVQPGDTLGTIAQKLLGDRSQWRTLAEFNQLQNPNLILVGQVIRVPQK